MTQFKINKAYPALMRLSELKMPVKKAKGLYELTKKVEEHFQFAISEEHKYIAEFNGKENPDGTISFESQDGFGKYQEKMLELGELEIDWNIVPIIISENDIGTQSISSSDIYSLEDFVSFE